MTFGGKVTYSNGFYIETPLRILQNLTHSHKQSTVLAVQYEFWN